MAMTRKKDLLLGERMRVKQEGSDGRSEESREEGARFECSLHQALARASVGWALSVLDWAVRRVSRHLR